MAHNLSFIFQLLFASIAKYNRFAILTLYLALQLNISVSPFYDTPLIFFNIKNPAIFIKTAFVFSILLCMSFIPLSYLTTLVMGSRTNYNRGVDIQLFPNLKAMFYI